MAEFMSYNTYGSNIVALHFGVDIVIINKNTIIGYSIITHGPTVRPDI